MKKQGKSPDTIKSTFKREELSVEAIFARCTTDAKTGCILWNGIARKAKSTSKKIHPLMFVYTNGSKVNVQVRKWVHEYTEGALVPKAGVMVLPSCGNDRCVNPEHAYTAVVVNGEIKPTKEKPKPLPVLTKKPVKVNGKVRWSRDAKPSRPYKEVSQFVPRQRIDAWLHGMAQ